MSHVRYIKESILPKHITHLKAACAELAKQGIKVKFKENQKTIRWWGRWANDYAQNDAAYLNGIPIEKYGTCDHAIEVEGSGYDIGVFKKADGNYTLYYDFYGRHGSRIEQVLGKACERLRSQYQQQVVKAEAKKLGWTMQTKKVGKIVEITASVH